MTTNNKKTDPVELTPITKQPINQVHSDRWQEMTVSELWEERITLNNRLTYALQIGHADMIKQLNMGIKFLDQLIQSKTTTTERLF